MSVRTALALGLSVAFPACDAEPDGAAEQRTEAEIVVAQGDGDPGDEGASAVPAGRKPPIAFVVDEQPGRWHEGRVDELDEDLTDEQRSQIAQLEAIGYAEGVHEGTFPSGVTRHDVERAGVGLNLLTSAHEPGALLIDMAGEVLHRWKLDFAEVWPNYRGNRQNTSFWRRVHLFRNGDVLAIFEGLCIFRIDRRSRLLWSSKVGAHHDMVPMPDGSVWVLTREGRVIPRLHERRPVLEDFISLLDAGGAEVRRISILEALDDSQFSDHWSGEFGGKGDLFHTNSLERLDGRLAEVHPAFAEGNFLISMRTLNLIAVLDPEQERIVWALRGDFNRQHDPRVLSNGHLLLFDNNPRGRASRILELDPLSGEQAWVYQGSDSEPFYSATCGVAQRLSNGNTLVTESDYGRAFEVTSDGSIVWEYYSPFRAGKDGRYIATMMEMQRLAPGIRVDWAMPPGANR